jgi:hypothetical protein
VLRWRGVFRPAIALLVCARIAHANPAADVAGSIDGEGGRVDAIGTVTYEYEADSSTIWREHVGDPNADPNAPLPTQRDLAFRGSRHTIVPRLDIGVYHDFFLTFAMPVTITQSHELHLDQGVDRAGSSTIVDGFLPPAGFDAQDPSSPPPGDLVFRDVARHGIDQIHLGVGFAPMNQARDSTKPTWKLGAEARIAIGPVMKFDPTAPNANTAVGYGVHELRLWTSFDRRLGWAEPWMELWWLAPIGVTKDSLFQNPGYGSTNVGKGMQGGVKFGIEAYAYDDTANKNRVSIDVGGQAIAHFEGRDYSEMWEVFANNPALGLDADPTTAGVQPMAHPGITNIENYLETRATAAVRATIGPHVRFAATVELMWQTDHAITFADAGVDLPTCSATITSHCEADNNNVVNPGTAEVNPVHNDKIDLVGHRYLSEDNFGVIVGVQGELLF